VRYLRKHSWSEDAYGPFHFSWSWDLICAGRLRGQTRKVSTNCGQMGGGISVNFSKSTGLEGIRIAPDDMSIFNQKVAIVRDMERQLAAAKKDAQSVLDSLYADAEPLTYDRLRAEIAKEATK